MTWFPRWRSRWSIPLERMTTTLRPTTSSTGWVFFTKYIYIEYPSTFHPSPASECPPPPPEPKGGDKLACGRGCGGVPIQTTEIKAQHSVYSVVFSSVWHVFWRILSTELWWRGIIWWKHLHQFPTGLWSSNARRAKNHKAPNLSSMSSWCGLCF